MKAETITEDGREFWSDFILVSGGGVVRFSNKTRPVRSSIYLGTFHEMEGILGNLNITDGCFLSGA